MKHSIAGFRVASLGLCLALSISNPSALAAKLPGKSCHLPGQEGPLRCLFVDVPLDYQQTAKGKLALHVTIAPAFREQAKADPVFVLAGGPGQSGSAIVMMLDAGMQRVRATRDIIFIDQRGTGKSGKLGCEEMVRNESLDPDTNEKLLTDCLTKLKPDLSHYTTKAAAQDIDTVRRVLGFKTINLWGGSYGSRLAQEYAHQFPQQLRSMVIDGVAAPQQNIGLISGDTGRAVGLLVEKCQQDAACQRTFPHFKQQLDELMVRAKSGTEVIRFKHPVTAKESQMPLRHESLAEVLRGMLYSPIGAARLPWMVQQAHAGNWQPLIAASYVNQNWSQDGMAIGLTLAVLCGEDIAHLQPAEVLAETPLSFVGDSWARKMQRWCDIVKLPKRERPSQGKITTPTLLLSGATDPITPPSRAIQALEFLPNGQHLIAKQVGHIVTMQGCTQRLIRQFFDDPRKKLDGACLNEIGKTPFVMSAAGAEP